MEGTKHDDGKLPMHLIPLEALEGVARVMGFGAKKYGDYNWMCGFNASRLYAATLRHLFAYWKGSNADKESSLLPLDHAIAELMMLRSLIERGSLRDDRPLRSERPYNELL